MKKKILLVINNKLIRGLFQAELIRDYEVVIAKSGGTACGYLIDCPDDVVHLLITELEMPEMKGDQLIEIINAHRPDLPTILILESSSGGRYETVADSFLRHPFSLSDLRPKIKVLLGE